MWDELMKWLTILVLVCFGLGFAVIPIMITLDTDRVIRARKRRRDALIAEHGDPDA